MTSIDIGPTITATVRGQQIIGRVVGREDASCRRGYTSGTLLTVDVGGGTWLEIHSRFVVQKQEVPEKESVL